MVMGIQHFSQAVGPRLGHGAINPSGVTLVVAELGVSGAVRLDRPALGGRVQSRVAMLAMVEIRWVPGR